METLTRLEIAALDVAFNLSDGHSRLPLTKAQEDVVRSLPELFHEAGRQSQSEIEASYQEAFFAAAGQDVANRRISAMFHYAASIGIIAVGMLIQERGLRCGLIHPTFDNLAALLVRCGVSPVPFDESVLRGDLSSLEAADIDVCFVVSPNNPTGHQFTEASFQELVDWCAREDVMLVLDASFRFFGDMHDWDQYRILDESGIDFVVIEDSGKTWPTLDVKVGMLLSSASLERDLRLVCEDIILSGPPLTLALVDAFIRADIGAEQWDRHVTARSLVHENRLALRDGLKGSGIHLANPTATVSVEWLCFPDRPTEDFCLELRRHGVAALPGGPFFWAKPELGRNHLRVSLARPFETVAAASRVMRTLAIEGR